MNETPVRIFLDTNVYIIGVSEESSDESKILDWIGFYEAKKSCIETIVSDELLTSISDRKNAIGKLIC